MAKRSLARRLLKPLFWASRFIDATKKLRRFMPERDAMRLARALQRYEPDELPVGKGTFRLRRHTSDLYTFVDVFLQDSMFLDAGDLAPQCIVDCGAHIGCTSLFFALKYPSCKIISLEPDTENFERLSKNLSPYPNVIPLNAAVWDRPSTVEVANPGGNPTGLQMKESDQEADRGIRGMTIPEIMDQAGADHIDILKIDIEGAERRLFDSPDCHSWLPRVSFLIIELHDRHVPGCSRALFRALDRYDYTYHECHGWVVIVELKGPASTPSPDR